VEDVEVPAPAIAPTSLAETAPVRGDAAPSERVPAPARRSPEWRVLPIAPTALADFEHCHRRFELVHLLGLPEYARGRRASRPDASGDAGLDARAQGTLAHAVLEHLPVETFLSRGDDDVAAAVARALEAAGVPEAHPQHVAIAGRALRFLKTKYSRSVAEAGATITREVSFVLSIEDQSARAVTLRGSMDLVVAWPDGSVDVVDYKSARAGDTASYAFQLDVYALAARACFPEATRLRAGLAFLGAGTGEPVWHRTPPEDELRRRISKLGADLVHARWSGEFPRVALERCESIHCGFIGRCHPT
jgi:RecB family exonuclease